ncbi:DUF2938 family protein [Shimia sp. R10_1]|uniref:DUF2938 family protein n=1 Tax=Shimia sp. R10_1 TaxID=2821095 RepID=UPI001ADB1DC6|nr:DUF2938 family protein [Shimia sp. R10_1]MBO9475535.1 DUF2938 family protein [Shimia sp. R10_1]
MNFAELLGFGTSVGLGATVFMDVVAVLRQGLSGTNGFYCLVGRWIGSLPRSGFAHDDIRKSEAISGEALLGWSAHILMGVVFGVCFVLLFDTTVSSAILGVQSVGFGLGTVLVPWLIFQPLFGWGVAVSNTPDPWRLRLRSVITHGVFGVGLFVSALALRPLF